MLQSIIKDIKEYQDTLAHNINILSLIEPVIRTFDGKKITKRIETAVKKVLPEGYVTFYQFKYSWFELSIWGNGIKFDHSIRLTLGYNEFFSFEDYVERNQRYYLDKSRCEELDGYLNDPVYLKGLCDKKESLLKQMKEYEIATKNLPWPISQHFKEGIK